jgi:hypothetical protein
MFVIGIDPGLRGGIALVKVSTTGLTWVGEVVTTVAMPVHEDEIMVNALEAALIHCACDTREDINTKFPPIVIEKTLVLPGQAVKSAFSQGYNLGRVHGAIHSVGRAPIQVAPITWTTWLHKHARRTKDSKKDTWEGLSALLPASELAKVPRTPRSKVPHDGIVDAIGIALWYAVEGHKRKK